MQLTEKMEKIVVLPLVGRTRVVVEAKFSGDGPSADLMVMFYLVRPGDDIASGVSKMAYFDRKNMALQAGSAANLSMTVEGFTAWMIDRVIERSQDFLDGDYRGLNEFVSMKVKQNRELFFEMRPSCTEIMALARKACMFAHVVRTSMAYADGIGGDDITPEEMALLWSRRTIIEVMES